MYYLKLKLLFRDKLRLYKCGFLPNMLDYILKQQINEFPRSDLDGTFQRAVTIVLFDKCQGQFR